MSSTPDTAATNRGSPRGSDRRGRRAPRRHREPGPSQKTTAGVLSIIAGVLLVIWPEIGVLTLVIIFGVYLAAYGDVLLASAVMAPKGGKVPNSVG